MPSVEPQETTTFLAARQKLCEVVARDSGPNKSFDHICDVLSGADRIGRVGLLRICISDAGGWGVITRRKDYGVSTIQIFQY